WFVACLLAFSLTLLVSRLADAAPDFLQKKLHYSEVDAGRFTSIISGTLQRAGLRLPDCLSPYIAVFAASVTKQVPRKARQNPSRRNDNAQRRQFLARTWLSLLPPPRAPVPSPGEQQQTK